MSRLNDLLRELRTREPALARDLEREVSALAERRAFGLNFERHIPEVVELPGRKVRKGDKVRVLPPRGRGTKNAVLASTDFRRNLNSPSATQSRSGCSPEQS